MAKRIEQIVHCRLRLEMSDLYFGLFNRYLTDNPSRACGHPLEIAGHLLYCPILDIKANHLDIKNFIVQELCESRSGRPGLSVLTSLLVSVDVKIY